jgi:hypothetical protein
LKYSREYVIALSLANLFFLKHWYGIILGGDEVYFSTTVIPNGAFSLLSCILLYSLLIFGLIVWAEKIKTPFLSHLIYLLVLLSAVVPLRHIQYFTQFSIKYPVLSYRYFLGDWGHVGNYFKLIILSGATLAAYFRWPRVFISGFRGIALVFSCAAIFSLGTFATYSLQDIFLRRNAASVTQEKHPPQIIWMLFDEMDEHYVTEGRPPGLPLPNFDKFRAESFYATNVHQPAGQTILSIPTYFTGKVVVQARPASRNDLAINFCNDRVQRHWEDLPNLLGEARARNYRTGILGWYHPYCRLFAGQYDYCRSFPFAENPMKATYLASVQETVWSPFYVYDTVRIHRKRYYRILEAAEDLARAGNIDFLFLHWSVPHPPEVLKRSEWKFFYPENAAAELYFNNLMAADRAFGRVRELMEQKGTWDSAYVIVTSDHGWRKAPAEPFPWEKRKAKFMHVPLLIKFPHQKEAVKYTSLFNGVLLHDILLQIMDGKLASVKDLPSWLTKATAESSYQPEYDKSGHPHYECEVY